MPEYFEGVEGGHVCAASLQGLNLFVEVAKDALDGAQHGGVLRKGA